jgi:4-alpha-glucanotransferase
MSGDSNGFTRCSGVLLHPTSLPGPFGIGDLGKSAFQWIDWLANAKQSWWQILPLGPTGFGNSPYQSYSAFAGNPLLISPESLVRDGLLKPRDVRASGGDPGRVDFANVEKTKSGLLREAWENFQAARIPALAAGFDEFRAAEDDWLDDFSLYMAIKKAEAGRPWSQWPADLRPRRPDSLAEARRSLHSAIDEVRFTQYLFARQWRELRDYAEANGVRILGDVPIFVAGDSADVWAHPENFWLDAEGKPTVVAGVPPDYFSKTGQLWGNPLYRWDRMAESGFAWWMARLRKALEHVHSVRLDHFRGFEGYWEIPASLPTAEIGKWVKGPGAAFFIAARGALGSLPLIAENLGVITDEVESLRTSFALPGMCVIQFAFSGPTNSFLPHHHERNSAVYTGTHDNDTTVGWYGTLSEAEKDYLTKYLAHEPMDIAWELLRMAWASVANLAIAPVQDLLGLGTEARMNFPGKPAGNWEWRLRPDQLTDADLERLREVTETFDRAPNAAKRHSTGNPV